MKMSDQEILELHELLDRLVENNLPTHKRKYLEEWLSRSEEARKVYISHIDMSASLSHYANERIADELSAPLNQKTSGKLIRFLKPLIPIAALVLVGLYIYSTYRFSEPNPLHKDLAQTHSPSSIPTYESGESEAIAILTHAVGLIWEDDAIYRPKVGSSLHNTSLKIAKGVAQVELVDGVTLILEGPVDYELIHGNSGSLKRGKLRAHVPKVAIGFTVGLPMGEVIDLGTDFGVEVHEEESAELYVYRGKVCYQGIDATGNHISEDLVSGQAIYINRGGYTSPLDMPTGSYLGSADLANRSLEESQLRRSKWLEYSRKLLESPRTRLYFGFDNHAKWDRVLKDETVRKDGMGNGAIIGCNWTQGRWPGKGALQFSKSNDRVCLNLPGELPSITLAAWIKIDELSSPISPLIFSRPYKTGAIGWSVEESGKLVLQVHVNNKEVINYFSGVALPREKLGLWVHLATSYDSENNWVCHYVNGRSFSREKIDISLPLSLKKGLIGYSQDFHPYRKGIALKGCMDEFAIFDDAWEEAQVRELYEVGTPYLLKNSLISHNP